MVGFDVDESLLNEEGKLCLDRAGLAAFAHGEYFALGEVIGKFGFSVAKESKRAPVKGKAPTGKPAAKGGGKSPAPKSRKKP